MVPLNDRQAQHWAQPEIPSEVDAYGQPQVLGELAGNPKRHTCSKDIQRRPPGSLKGGSVISREQKGGEQDGDLGGYCGIVSSGKCNRAPTLLGSRC